MKQFEVILMVWDVGDPIGTGDDIGAPEVPYMSYGPRRVENDGESEEERRKRKEEEEKERKIRELEQKAKSLADEAWILCMEERYDEALVFINRSLEYRYNVANSLNRKAIILERLERYEEAIQYYDRAIEQPHEGEVIEGNKARCLVDYAWHLKDTGFNDWGLKVIKKSLKLFQKISDKEREDEAWYLKGMFLESFNKIPWAFNCYKRAYALAQNKGWKKSIRKKRNNLLQFIENTDIPCPNCGEMLKITANKCFKCGEPIDESIKIVLKKDDDSAEEIEMDVEYEPVCDADIIHFDED